MNHQIKLTANRQHPVQQSLQNQEVATCDHCNTHIDESWQPESKMQRLALATRDYLRALFNFESVMPQIIRLCFAGGLAIFTMQSHILADYPALEKLSLLLLTVAFGWQIVSSSFHSALLPMLTVICSLVGIYLLPTIGEPLHITKMHFIWLFSLGATSTAIALTFAITTHRY